MIVVTQRIITYIPKVALKVRNSTQGLISVNESFAPVLPTIIHIVSKKLIIEIISSVCYSIVIINI